MISFNYLKIHLTLKAILTASVQCIAKWSRYHRSWNLHNFSVWPLIWFWVQFSGHRGDRGEAWRDKGKGRGWGGYYGGSWSGWAFLNSFVIICRTDHCHDIFIVIVCSWREMSCPSSFAQLRPEKSSAEVQKAGGMISQFCIFQNCIL